MSAIASVTKCLLNLCLNFAVLILTLTLVVPAFFWHEYQFFVVISWIYNGLSSYYLHLISFIRNVVYAYALCSESSCYSSQTSYLDMVLC